MFQPARASFNPSHYYKETHLKRRTELQAILRGFLLLTLLFSLNPFSIGRAAPNFQGTPEEQALALLNSLTPEQRVGQLFLIAFNGLDVGPDSQIYDLIVNHYVGGVTLLAAKDNFAGGNNTVGDVIAFTRRLQQDSWVASQQSRVNPVSGENFTPAAIPLFIGMPQEGDGYPYDQILNGVTMLPNEMAIGATWKPDLASQIGNILGKELSALGINLLIGPSLDVLEKPNSQSANDLGTRTFGGDPYWVGEMGRAYIQGIHTGSEGKVAVIAKHFPGHGGSDRLPEDEVSTVPKTLEQLKSFELQPFFSVTGLAPSPEATTDGLLTSHIRFQGNLRATTRPVSLDPQAFKQLMSLPPLDAWRKNGGVMVSDDLGSPAIQGYYKLTGQVFDMPRRVALNAFLAGNDLLYITDFSSGDLDSYTSAVQTLDFFAQKYREDPAFSQRVDESVLRILTLKYRLYNTFSLGRVLTPVNGAAQVGKASQATFQVAREAATLISPTQGELADNAPDPPNQNDRLVFITDTRTGQQCSQCPAQPLIGVKALEQVVLRLFGPQAGRQVSPGNLISYSLSDLDAMLIAGKGDSDIEKSLQRANWIVFSMLNQSNETPSFQTLSRFLAERPDLLQQKRLIVFAFNAPYYLDATNISKLTAYYGLYSKASQFIDAAAYLLFREQTPVGAPPVSVPGTSYDLSNALSPDPNQTVPLLLDYPTIEITGTTTTPAPQPAVEFHVGDVIPIRTAVILDHNGNAVPDGTPVDFIFTSGGDGGSIRQTQVTSNGIARTTYPVANSGTLKINAEIPLPSLSPPVKSLVLTFDIPSPNGESATVTPTEKPTAAPTITPTSTIAPTVGVAPSAPPPSRPHFSDWVMAILMSIGIAWATYRLASLIGQVRWGIRSGFLALIGGLLAYSYTALQMPGTEQILNGSVSRGVFLVTLFGSFLGLMIALSWRAVGTSPNEKV